MNTRPVVGIDLGGTASRIVVMADEHVLASSILTTPHERGTALATLITHIRQALEMAGVAATAIVGIGIGASGPVDADGVIRNPVSLPAFSDVPLRTALQDEFGTACVVDNDAVTAALAEARQVHGRSHDGLLMVTLGTGVGVALIRDGLPYRGADGVHPEGGHVTIPGPAAPCYCGRATCLEQLGSRSSLQAAARAATVSDDLAALARSAAEGRTAAVAVFAEYGTHVGNGLVELCTQHRPGTVVLGGSASRYLELFRSPLMGRLSTLRDAPVPDVLASRMDDVGGAIGAASLIRERR